MMTKPWGTSLIETIITQNGRDYEVSATSSIQVVVDRDYGSDADGNRGSCQTFIENSKTEIHSITLAGSSENLKHKLDKETIQGINMAIVRLASNKDINDYDFAIEPYE